MFDLSKIFDLSKKFTLPDTLLKSKNYCTGNQNLLILNVSTFNQLFKPNRQVKLDLNVFNRSDGFI